MNFKNWSDVGNFPGDSSKGVIVVNVLLFFATKQRCAQSIGHTALRTV